MRQRPDKSASQRERDLAVILLRLLREIHSRAAPLICRWGRTTRYPVKGLTVCVCIHEANLGGTTRKFSLVPLWTRLFSFITKEVFSHMDMQEQLLKIQEEAQEQLAAITDKAGLDALKLRLMGKKGELSLLRRSMGQIPAEDRPKAGQMINEVGAALTEKMDALDAQLRQKEQEKKLASEAIDVTEPRKHAALGMQHPISLVQDQMLSVFTSMGFDVVEGPEVEFDLYNFELMNIPKNHPARDAQDTFYIEDNVVLRTHTSPVQARTMLNRKPPIRIVCPGRVYRADEVDATHSPVFHQMEGLVVAEDVTMADLKGTLDAFAQKLFGEDMTTRFRPSFFPFTEPSAEVDLTCVNCHGKGCRICKGTGWIEVLGAGMVNPKVLEMCGIDSKKYSGFAFGVGLERIAMLRYGITDMRALFEGDVRFLSQFRDD